MKVTKKNGIKAYKVFEPDWTCREFQYEVGKTYIHKGAISICESGFHACEPLAHCFSYYSFDPQNKVAEVILWGDVESGGDKTVASKITIVKELSWEDVLRLVNTGTGNNGYRNSGYRNSGNHNSGYHNSGNHNSGYHNSGIYNSGDYNSGIFNSGDYNSGIFCTDEPNIRSFNKDTSLKRSDIEWPRMSRYQLEHWVSFDNMSDDERTKHPKAESIGGYLKTRTYEEMWADGWAKDSDENKLRFFNLPNFDLEIFKEITGIDASSDYKRLKGEGNDNERRT